LNRKKKKAHRPSRQPCRAGSRTAVSSAEALNATRVVVAARAGRV
jgi:hypothetical protein